jgi:drug/metabolite transporter (DMT)-like permease
MLDRMTPAASGHLAMFFFSLFIAGSFSLGTRIANLMDPIALMALRFVLAGVIVGIFVWRGPGLKRVHAAASWRYLMLGGLMAGYFVFMFEGLKTAPPVSASSVYTLVPIMTAIAGYFLLGQHVGTRVSLALLIGAVGATWVIFGGQLSAILRFEPGRGEIIYFFGCILHAAYSPMVRKLNRGEPAIVFTFGMIVAAAAILLVLGAPELKAADWASFPPLFWIGLAYLTVFASAASFFLLQYASLRLPSGKLMAYTYLTPSWVVLWELGMTASVPPLAIMIGILATMLSVALLLRD